MNRKPIRKITAKTKIQVVLDCLSSGVAVSQPSSKAARRVSNAKFKIALSDLAMAKVYIHVWQSLQSKQPLPN